MKTRKMLLVVVVVLLVMVVSGLAKERPYISVEVDWPCENAGMYPVREAKKMVYDTEREVNKGWNALVDEYKKLVHKEIDGLEWSLKMSRQREEFHKEQQELKELEIELIYKHLEKLVDRKIISHVKIAVADSMIKVLEK